MPGKGNKKAQGQGVTPAPSTEPTVTPFPDPDSLRIMYQRICAEVSRYRDREWMNVTTFTAAIAAILTLVIGASDGIPKTLLGLSLFLLAAGCIYYTSHAHRALARNRCIHASLEQTLGLDKRRLEPLKKDRRANWYRGFWSHLVPFFFADTALAMFGLWKIYPGEVWMIVLAGVVLLGVATVLCLTYAHDRIPTRPDEWP